MLSTHAVLSRHHVSTDLVADLAIPALTGLQRQGDIIVKPVRPGKDAGVPVGCDGVAVVRGEAGGNTHLLVAVDGAVSWRSVSSDMAVQGVVTVPAGGQAGLLHPEHGLTLIGPGAYSIERQQEFADQIRLVQD
jgi:hypothetical protein